MKNNYGVPYQGSKNTIAAWIVEQLPPAKNFYDLFAGGCAVTHAAILSGKYENFYLNDIDPDGIELFTRAINGEYANEERWISREDFFRLKDEDPYVKYCFSFGNCGRTYLYSPQLEPYKKALHEMFFAETVQERRIKYRTVARLLNELITAGKYAQCSLERLQSLQSLERLQRLESLERLQSLQSLEGLNARLFTSAVDYSQVEIMPDSVIYCDPPYYNIKRREKYYGVHFDSARFWEWASRQNNIYISELNAPTGFEIVAEKKKRYSIRVNYTVHVQERLYTPNKRA